MSNGKPKLTKKQRERRRASRRQWPRAYTPPVDLSSLFDYVQSDAAATRDRYAHLHELTEKLRDRTAIDVEGVEVTDPKQLTGGN